MTIELFPLPPKPPPAVTPFVSTPVTNPEESLRSSTTVPELTLPARRRRPSREDPRAERRDRELRDQTKRDMADAVFAVLQGTERLPVMPTSAEIWWLSSLVAKPCRVHLGGWRGVECPGYPDCHAAIGANPPVYCDHDCPRPPHCFGSAGRLVSCSFSRLTLERKCGRWLAEPISCHVPACPDCEPQRQAKLALRYEAVLSRFDWRDVVLTVFTAQNPCAGELRPELRRHVRDLAKLRRTPVFTGRTRCVARDRETGAPFHPCRHAGCARVWRCRRHVCSDFGKRTWRRRQSCSAVAGGRDRCKHPDCRPNCLRYRHRGVRGGVFSTECPPSTETPGSWNLHTNAILVLRDRGDADHKYKPWLAQWAELSWYWSRATCRVHRRCPGKPLCEGGAWEVDVKAYEPRDGIREYLKYVTKSADVLEHAGAGGLIEFLLARRRVKFLSAFGDLFGTRFTVDDADQAAADAETVWVWVSEYRKRRFPRICAACGAEADWDGMCQRAVARVDLELVNGFLFGTGPPVAPPAEFVMLPGEVRYDAYEDAVSKSYRD